MYGLVLEGGGGRGAYQIGVWKALRELNIKIKAVTGTSVGALNGAFIALDLYDEAYDLWENITPDQVLDTDNEIYREIINMKFNVANIDKYLEISTDFFKNKGFKTEPLRNLVDKYIDEEKLRKSKIDYGLVTVSITDKKAKELFVEEIPKGKLIDYILASALFPAFQTLEIDGEKFIDGGLYDNLPINLLSRKKVDKIIAVEMKSIGLKQKIKEKGLDITYISPSEDIGKILNFDAAISKRNIKMGYFDTLKTFGKCKGIKYYITNVPSSEKIIRDIANYKKEKIKEIADIVKYKEECNNRAVFESIIPKTAGMFDASKEDDYDNILIRILEYLAEKENVDRLKIYTYKELIEVVEANISKEKKAKGKNSKYTVLDIWETISGENMKSNMAYRLFKEIIE